MTRSLRRHAAVALLLLAFHLVLVCMRFPEESQQIIPTKKLLNRVLDATERVVAFYEEYSKKMNLDGIFGSRAAEAQLRGFLKRSEGMTSFNYLDEQFQRIQSLQKRLEKATDKSFYYVSQSEPEYFKRMKFLLKEKIWETRREYHKFDIDIFSNLQQQENYSLSEEKSDQCISALNDQCSISDDCFRTMSVPGSSYYTTTHELLYFIIGERLGCYTKLTDLSAKIYNQSVEQIKENLCANIFQQVSTFAKDQFPKNIRDLFMEQVFVCGIEGHQEFFKPAWIINILKWQKPDGCYGFEDKLIQKRRFQREVRPLTKMCESHATSVAVAALSQIILYLMDVLT